MTLTRSVDAKARVTLPGQFAGKTVRLEAVTDDGLRIRVVKARRTRPSLASLLARVTDANLPEKWDFGSPVGEEL